MRNGRRCRARRQRTLQREKCDQPRAAVVDERRAVVAGGGDDGVGLAGGEHEGDGVQRVEGEGELVPRGVVRDGSGRVGGVREGEGAIGQGRIGQQDDALDVGLDERVLLARRVLQHRRELAAFIDDGHSLPVGVVDLHAGLRRQHLACRSVPRLLEQHQGPGLLELLRHCAKPQCHAVGAGQRRHLAPVAERGGAGQRPAASRQCGLRTRCLGQAQRPKDRK